MIGLNFLRITGVFSVWILGTIGPGTAQQSICPSCSDGSALISRFGLREGAIPVRDRPDWAAPRRIVMHGPPNWAEPLRAAAPGVPIMVAPTPDSAAKILADADVYFGICIPAVVNAGKNLQWIQLWSAGADPCAGAIAASGRPVLLTNAQALYGPQIAEHAMAFIFALVRRLNVYRDEQRAQQWSLPIGDVRAVTGLGIYELEGKNLLVIGLGGIGTEVARRAHAMGMRVRATRNTGREGPDYVEYVGLANEAVELTKWADIVVNCTPLTPDTRGMFNIAFFSAMKPSAYFINVGRGESVVTADLVKALEARRIAGAALDVTDPEPLPRNHPLWSMPNVILTPHNAVASDLVQTRALTLAAENLRRYLRGDRLVSVVDVKRGY
jgi:phosphoglycerate dehydrogenase-like enzyme